MADIPAMLAAYYADCDPSRLPVIADAMEESLPHGMPVEKVEGHRLKTVAWLRACGIEVREWQPYQGPLAVVPPPRKLYTVCLGNGYHPLATADEQRAKRELANRVKGQLPIVERVICQFGCVICQTWHDEDDGPIFWQHIHRHGKHQGPCDKVCKGQWVWKNEPYWTRDPARKAIEKEIGGCAGCGAKFFDMDEALEHECSSEIPF